jgi:RNA polymerase sigma factor (sigma-70 family)
MIPALDTPEARLEMTQKSARSDSALEAATSERLLQDARGGRVSALNALFARHLPVLRRYARGRLPRWARTMADTTDLVQDVLLQTFRRLSGFESRGEGALRAYLRRAVDNRVRDELRRVSRRGTAAVLNDLFDDPGPSPFDEARAGELEDRYRAALTRLRPTDRDLVVAHVELGYTNEQLALMTGRRRVDSVRVALARALHRLAAEMGDG